MTILYNYRKIEQSTDKIVDSKIYSDSHLLEIALRNEYAALTQFEQAAATTDIDELVEMIQPSQWQSVLADMELGEQNEIPFSFESKEHLFFVDVILHKETDAIINNILYDYTVMDTTGKDIIQRYLFNDVTELHSMLLDEFLTDHQSKKRIEDYSKFETAFVNIDTAYYKQAIAKINTGLDLYEVSTLHFDFVADGNIHNIDVLIKGA